MIVFFFFSFFIKFIKVDSWDSRLIPILIMLFVNSEFIFEGEIKIKSLYFFASWNSSCETGPITIFIPADLISWMAVLSFSLLLKPESLGTIITFWSFISSRANCNEYKKEFPNSLWDPLRGASRPTFKILLCSLLKRLKLKKKYYIN